jgi:hypothetical protein
MTGIPFHPFANAFPLMDGAEFNQFVDDIKANGQREPIATYQSQILEGRNRYRACLRLKIEPRFVEFKGNDAGAHAFVISRNIHRRHLKPKDRQAAIATLLKLTPEKSDRVIAKEIGADHKTVAKVRREVVSTGETPAVEKRVGADGRARKQPERTPARGRGARIAKLNSQYASSEKERVKRRNREEWERWDAQATGEAQRLAAALLALDRDLAAALHRFLREGGESRFLEALDAAVNPASGNGVDPEEAAERRKQVFAAMEAAP